ncbi:melanoma antigen preferentially expressed in tumors-like [Perognathus longimembris pacificus]|uniref:melanoma antigen preferentially expressed in tumors-like n=1 Tax=Perognathus longimembris pacificus TaxID=214514 RepID=UPI002018A9BF|nr:melanoma antigen preferentially expressed in tumors-like [Perognathus longimembris pacificus]
MRIGNMDSFQNELFRRSGELKDWRFIHIVGNISASSLLVIKYWYTVRCMNMDPKNPATLLDLAIQTVVKNESVAIRAAEEIPQELFIPLFNAAFTGGHTNVVKAVVRTWPFPCLHVGALHLPEPYSDILEAMLDSLQFLPVHNPSSRVPKLRILDLRQNADCMTTCSGISSKFPFCFEACVYSKKSITKKQETNANLEAQPSGISMEVLVDLYIDGTWMTKHFLSALYDKVEHGLGSLHLCCRYLQVDKVMEYKRAQRILDMMCIDHLGVDEASLSEVCMIIPGMIHLTSLNLYKIKFRSYKKKPFKMFLSHLSRMNELQELFLSYFSLKNHVHKVLRVLSPKLDSLNLNFCELTNKDLISMSQKLQDRNIKLLNISHNQMSWENFQPLRMLLENISGTLQHLEMNNCLITDIILSGIIPALRVCTNLRVITLACNPITMAVLRNLLHNLTLLVKLKFVIYPIPMHCYDHWHFRDSLDEEKLAEVKLEIRTRLRAAQLPVACDKTTIPFLKLPMEYRNGSSFPGGISGNALHGSFRRRNGHHTECDSSASRLQKDGKNVDAFQGSNDPQGRR